MTSKNILKVVKERNKIKGEKEKKKEESKEKKQKEMVIFLLCKTECKCERPNGKCVAISLKQCAICNSILKSQCTKKACRSADESKPSMIKVSDATKKSSVQIAVSDLSSHEVDEALYS